MYYCKIEDGKAVDVSVIDSNDKELELCDTKSEFGNEETNPKMFLAVIIDISKGRTLKLKGRKK